MYPQGVAKCGAVDMAGNLWEWCLNKSGSPEVVEVDASGDSRVLRGGSFYDDLHSAACACRSGSSPSVDYFNYGLRLVLSAPGTSLTSDGWAIGGQLAG
jgi:formylglycine-generating enzyme required for sulfatase activity